VRFFALNLILALVWMSLVGYGRQSLLVGFLFGFLALVLARPFLGSAPYVRSVLGIIKLSAIFFFDIVRANVQLARDILSPRPPFNPAFLRLPAHDLGPGHTTLLAAMISLTPGSVTVDSDNEGHVLYVHTMYAENAEQTRRSMRRYAELIHEAAGHEPREWSVEEG
jgi:multicomponent Na+:H+ antiporter subunit E